MDIGVFQLLPQPEAVSEREVIEQALWEVDFAEAHGYSSVWVTEHHLSAFGLIGAPSVYAAAVAQRTRRIDIGYAVAVVPLHHPLRLAEEIAWVDHLSHGRLLVGVGPGFSPYEFGAFGVPLAERQALLDEGLAIVRGALEQPVFSHSGAHWTIPPVTLKPRPYRGSPPPFLRASSSPESLRQAALAGMPLLLGLRPTREIAQRIAAYRAIRAGLGVSPAAIDGEVAEFRVLRRVAADDSDEAALASVETALACEAAIARRVHEAGAAPGPTLADGSVLAERVEIDGGCVGTPATVLRHLRELHDLGIRHVIAWLNFGDMPFAKVRRSMERLAHEVIPRLSAGDDAPASAAVRLPQPEEVTP